MSREIIAELTDATTLRAGINMSNGLLVTGKTPSGDPVGVAPDMARAVADRLGVALKLVPFPSPSDVANAVAADGWDIALIGAEPQRAATITFSDAYVGIEATYLVPAGSPIRDVAEVDRPGIRIASPAGAAYDLYLARNIKNAKLIQAKGGKATQDMFVSEKLEALAGLRSSLNETVAAMPGARVLAGNFTLVQQAIGTKPKNKAMAAFLQAFVAETKASGFVAGLITKHGVTGRLLVA